MKYIYIIIETQYKHKHIHHCPHSWKMSMCLNTAAIPSAAIVMHQRMITDLVLSLWGVTGIHMPYSNPAEQNVLMVTSY